MPNNSSQQTWKNYLDIELPLISALVAKQGYSLDSDQPHIKGERFLMQAITTSGGKKIILYGKNKTGERVVIKATRDADGQAELQHERTCRTLLHKLHFAYDTFHSPRELAYIKQAGFVITINEFIEQASTFLDRPLPEQFSFSLQALQAQERARATTAGHIRSIKQVFNYRTITDYLKLHAGFLTFLQQQKVDARVFELVTAAHAKLTNQQERIEQYCGFLTHTDFVPHNFRIHDDTLYLLDFSSLQFGNKHESWARFLNFMTLYNPELETLLVNYVEQNRAPEERESLQLMRLFRLGEIITYYVKNVTKSDDALQTLNQNRVQFWADVLAAELKNTRVSREVVQAYQTTRDNLRSQEEKERQVGLH
ncbi:MAG: hypothetical protein RLZZ230_424 [Candidatus Parcubacteria bacterium]|jgi:hypothetical protein